MAGVELAAGVLLVPNKPPPVVVAPAPAAGAVGLVPNRPPPGLGVAVPGVLKRLPVLAGEGVMPAPRFAKRPPPELEPEG